MSIFDNLKDLAGDALGKAGGEANLLTQLPGLLQGLGGSQEITEKFKSLGLEKVLQSWTSEGQNLSVSNDQIQKLFGNEKIQELISKTGLSTEDLTSKINQLLPGILGKLPALGDLLKK